MNKQRLPVSVKPSNNDTREKALNSNLTVETETPNPLPNIEPLAGVVCKQWIPRGPHGKQCGPYHYRMWRDNGRLRKQYIKPEDVPAITARCDAYREQQTAERVAIREAAQLRVKLLFEQRAIEGKDNG